jgi:hypothetical protein
MDKIILEGSLGVHTKPHPISKKPRWLYFEGGRTIEGVGTEIVGEDLQEILETCFALYGENRKPVRVKITLESDDPLLEGSYLDP